RPGHPGATAVPRLAQLLELARILARARVRPGAAVDDDLHVRVVLVVLAELLVQLFLELRWDDAVDHSLSVRTWPALRLDARDVRDDPAVVAHVRVPLGERALEVV